ncbi:unnamed protein product [Ceutorhynchus assimilis]|uniref:Uncharacterized protein n=1 Tax=Ceutorhynchus assimilis TaxID=467358 RepID=A0A9N9QKX7_9CUCU|nr:unnamed protein product [Ceutorhynchus assimilis]
MTSCSQDTFAADRNIKCSTCLGRTRKIEELEGMVSCKNDILSAQQSRLYTFETNYKRLFDDFERLRLDYSYALQANCSLKEINLKLEQVTVTKSKRCTFDAKQKLSAIGDSERIIESSQSEKQSHYQEFKKKSTILETQNYTLKINKTNHFDVKEPLQGQESGDSLNSNSFIKEIQGKENLIKIIFPEQIISELSHSAVIGTGDSMACNSKCITKKDKQTITINIEDPNLPMMVVDLKIHMQQQSKQFEKCAGQLVDQLDDMHGSNQVLADTLSVVTEENKNNLQIIADLKSELKRVNEEYEAETREMKRVIDELENEVEENKIIGKTLRNSISITESEVQKLQGALKEAEEQKGKPKDCKCQYGEEFQDDDEIDMLRRELEERKTELGEYEEENKHYSQTIESLNKQNNDLLTKIRQLEKNGNIQSEKSCHVLNDKIQQLEEENEFLYEEGKKHELEMYKKLSEVDRLKSTVITQGNELDGLSFENDELKKEIEQLKRDNQLETEKLQEAVEKSQIQVEKLLKEHDAKSNEIEQVANELTNIRRSVDEDNGKYLGIIKNLEKEREDLQIKLKQMSEHSDCICGASQSEMEKLKAELFKKQAIIYELERSMNELTKSFKHFDRTADDLAYENSMLKNDRDNYVRDLEALQAALSEKINELEEMRKKLENSDVLCDKCVKAGRDTSLERSSTYACQYCDNLETKMEMMKRDREKLDQEKRKMEMSVANYYQLQMELDSLRGQSQKRDSITCNKLCELQKGYDELKYLYDVRTDENEKLRNDLLKSEAQRNESEKKCECITMENKKLRGMKEENEHLQKACASKSIDIEVLKDDLKAETEQRQICNRNCEGLKKKQACTEIELLGMKDRLDDLSKKYEDKSQEFKKIKKQYDSCCKLSKISREEYSTLRKEYKEIKTMLSEQVKKYKRETESVDGRSSRSCDVVKEMRNQLLERERQMDQIQQKLKDSGYEIIELKDYVHKLISDNNALKKGINSLIGNLESKIKGDPSLGSFPSNSAEAIAGEILHSLSNIEDIISKNPPICPKGCESKNCDCMNQITSQYSFKTENQQGSSRGCAESRSTYNAPKCKAKTEILHRVSSEPGNRCMPEPSRVTSETNTTDSDDQNADRKSLKFFKDAIVDLRTRIHKTMKEKCCDCEEVSAYR